jgi:hypothetical protein
MRTSVTAVDPLSDPRWDSFVEAHPRATVYHLAAWARILADVYRYKPVYLKLETEAGEVRGVLPLLGRRGPLSGSRLRSLPVLPHVAGPLAHTPEEAAVLVRAACSVANNEGSVLTINTREPGLELLLPELGTVPRLPSWIITLPPDLEALDRWLNGKGRSRDIKDIARRVRQAGAAGVRVREGGSEDDLHQFYKLYLVTMRKHRVLPRSYRQLTLSRRMLQPSGVFRLFLAERDGRAVTGVLCYAFRDTVDALYLGADDRSRELHAHHALYWELMKWSVAHNYRKVDLGTASTAGSLGAWKLRWGAEPICEYRYVYPAPRRHPLPPAAAARQQDAADRRSWRRDAAKLIEKRARFVWNRAPCFVTRLAGAFILKYL